MKAIKEFLKPNWWKIIVAFIVLLTLIYFFAGALLNSCKPKCVPGQYEEGVIKIDCPLTGYPPDMICVFTKLVAIIGASYLLSCLIYFITTKIKHLIAKPK